MSWFKSKSKYTVWAEALTPEQRRMFSVSYFLLPNEVGRQRELFYYAEACIKAMKIDTEAAQAHNDKLRAEIEQLKQKRLQQ